MPPLKQYRAGQRKGDVMNSSGVPAARSTPPASPRKPRPAEEWDTDSDTAEEDLASATISRTQHEPTRSRKSPVKVAAGSRRRTTSNQPHHPPTSTPFIFSLLARVLKTLLTVLLSPLNTFTLSLILPLFLISLSIYFGVHSLQAGKDLLPSFSVAPILSTAYCSTVGWGCKPDTRAIGAAARTATVKAEQALDVFQTLLQLGGEDSAGLQLHPVEAWELATAVRYSNLDDRVFVSSQLDELGDLIRDVKDEVISLNAQGINSFTWIVHEFTRLEDLLARASAPGSNVSPEALTTMSDALFAKINDSLENLLRSLDRSIPFATRASDHGRRIFGAIKSEESIAQKEWDGFGWVAKIQGWKGGQLRRDLELTRESAKSVVDIWTRLEGTRTSLLGYHGNVAHFKAGVIGFHLAGHGLSVDDEVRHLGVIMEEFRSTVHKAKNRGRPAPVVVGEGKLAIESSVGV